MTDTLRRLVAWRSPPLSGAPPPLSPHRRQDALPGEVALLAALDADLAEEERDEEANVPRDQVEPEGRVNAGALHGASAVGLMLFFEIAARADGPRLSTQRHEKVCLERQARIGLARERGSHVARTHCVAPEPGARNAET